MAEEQGLPTSVWSGTFRVLGVDVKCHTLSDGQRIIEADSFNDLMIAMGSEDFGSEDDDSAMFAAWRVGAKDTTTG